MSLLVVRGVTAAGLEADGFQGTHARPAPRRLLTGHVVGDSGHRDLWDWAGAVGPFDSEHRRIWELFLDGAGETWMWEGASAIGSRGSVPNAGGTYTVHATGGKFNGRVAVGSGSFIELPSTIVPANGWCVRVWRDEGSGHEHFVVWGTGTDVGDPVVRASKDGGAEVSATTYAIENWLSVASDGDVRLLGVTAAGANGAVDYSEPELRDYPVIEEIASGMSAVTTECYPLPLHAVGGSGIGLTPVGGARTIKARVSANNHRVALLGGDLKGMVPLLIMQTR